MPLHCLAQVARGARIPGPQRTETSAKTVLDRLPQPGFCKESRLKHTLRLPVKTACFLILELELQLEGHTHLEDMEVLTLSDGSQGDTVFVPSPGLTTAHWYFPESSLYTHLKP